MPYHISPPLIYHICTSESWKAQEKNHFIVHASLATEGFIHCSKLEQVEGVLSRYFDNVDDLLQLTIQTDRVERIFYEASRSGELFPHIYGPIPRGAISKVTKIK